MTEQDFLTKFIEDATKDGAEPTDDDIKEALVVYRQSQTAPQPTTGQRAVGAIKDTRAIISDIPKAVTTGIKQAELSGMLNRAFDLRTQARPTATMEAAMRPPTTGPDVPTRRFPAQQLPTPPVSKFQTQKEERRGIMAEAEKKREEIEAIKPSEASTRGIGKAIYEGIAALPTSVALSAPSTAGAALGLPGQIAGAALTARLAGGAEYESFLMDARRELTPQIMAQTGLKKEVAEELVEEMVKDKAAISAIIEGGGEALANFLFAKLTGLGQVIKKPFTSAANAQLNSTIKQFTKRPVVTAVKNTAINILQEAGTEALQAGGQAVARKSAGMESLTFGEAAKEAIGPAVVMSLIMGGAGTALTSTFSRNAQETIAEAKNNPTPANVEKAKRVFQNGIADMEPDVFAATVKDMKAGELVRQDGSTFTPAEIADLEALYKASIHPFAKVRTTQPSGIDKATTGAIAIIDNSNLKYHNTTLTGPGAEKLMQEFGAIGHTAGDRYISRTADAIRKAIKGTDIKIWLGGKADEWRLFSPTMTATELNAVIDQARANIPRFEFTGHDKEGRKAPAVSGELRGGAVDITDKKPFSAAQEEAGKIEVDGKKPTPKQFMQMQGQIIENLSEKYPAVTDPNFFDEKTGVSLRTRIENDLRAGKDAGLIQDEIDAYLEGRQQGEITPEGEPPTPQATPQATPEATPEAPPVAPAPPAETAEEPWQMLQRDFIKQQREELGDRYEVAFEIGAGDKTGKGVVGEHHKRLVKQALASGKPVPPEVLADYPDLKPPAKPAAKPDLAPKRGKEVAGKAKEGKILTPPAEDLKAFEILVEGNRYKKVVPAQLIRNEDGQVINRIGAQSEYSPEWRAMFGREGSVKGVGKDEVIRIYEKIKDGKALTERQADAYDQIIETLKDFESRAPEIAIADDLNTGDTFMKDGEKHTVKEITEDGQVKIQNGTTELLWPGETIEIDRGTLAKAEPQTEIAGAEKTLEGRTSFADLMTAIETPKENWQAVQDALRYSTPEEAMTTLTEQGIEISLADLKKAEPMVKGGAGVKREFQMSVAKGIEAVVGNMDQRLQEIATINPEYKKQLSDKFKQWEASDIREADQSIQAMMKWAGVEALPEYAKTVTPDGIDMTLHHDQMAKLIDNVSPADLKAVERMMGKDAYTFSAAGQRLYAEAATAAKTLNIVIEKYENTTDAVEKAKLEKLGTALLNHAIDNYGLYRNAMTNGGRLIEYARQNKKGDAYSDLNTFDNMMKSGEFSQFTEDNIVDAFKRIKQSKSLTVDGMVKAAEPTLMDKINEWQKAIKLTNPKTHIVNFSSNIANGLYNANIEKMLSVAVDAAGTLAGKPRTTFAGEIEAGWKAGVAAKTMATQKMLEALKNDLPNQRAWETQYNVREAIPGKAGKFIRTPFRMLNASDQYFYNINYNVALGQEVYADLYAKGKRGQKLWDEWAVKMNAPTDKQINTSKDKAEEWLYREKLDPANQGAQKILKDAPALQFILPFYKTPVNIAKWAYRRTPIIGLPGRNMADIKTGGRQAREAIARQVAGAAIYGSVAALWASGAITGPAPEDEDKRAEFYRQGKMPYGIKIGKRYYSYGRWEPLTTITKSLTTTLEAAEQYKKDKSRGLLSASGKAIGQISQSLLDQSYLLGLSNMFDAINDPVRSGQRFISSTILGATIPTGIGYVATATDSQIRQPRGLPQQAAARVPGLSKTIEPKLGVLGEPLYREGWAARLQPLVVSTPMGNNYKAWEGFGLTPKQVDIIEAELAKTDKPIPYPNRYYKDDKGVNKRYTPAEYNKLLLDRRRLLIPGLKDMILSPSWDGATIEEKQDALADLYRIKKKKFNPFSFPGPKQPPQPKF